MARYAVSQEGADAMKALAAGLVQQANGIMEASFKLEQQTAALDDGLGLYADEIKNIIYKNRAAIQTNRDSIIGLGKKVNEQANNILNYLSLGTGSDLNESAATTSAGTAVSAMAPTAKKPRDLPVSQYGFKKDADGNSVYDSPDETNQFMYTKQGSANKNYLGTCGLCSCVNILRLAGVNAEEAELIAYATTTNAEGPFQKKLCATGYGDPCMNGGTSPLDRRQILSHYGVDSGVIPLIREKNNKIGQKTIQQIADSVSTGRGTILSVHADILRADADVGIDDCHAVTVTSVKKDAAGNTLGFYICDSDNLGTSFYSAERVAKALTGSPMNITYSIIR